MWNFWNYTILILWLKHAHAFCSCQTSGNAAYSKFNCFYFMYPCLHIPSVCITPFGSLVRKEWKKELWVFHLSLPFYDIILCKWLANTGKDSMRKGYINSAPWSFVFLRMPLPSFCVQTKLLVQSKHSLSVTGWSLRWAHLGRDE